LKLGDKVSTLHKLPASFADDLAIFVFASAALKKILRLFCTFVGQDVTYNFQPMIQAILNDDII
jgi:hypothetical protein